MAKSVKALITPEVLKWAREKRIKLSLEHAARKLKVKREHLAAWENGTASPTITQLKKIANVYKTHVSLFYLPQPPTGFQPLTDYRVLPVSLSIDEEQNYRLNANIVEAFERRETLIELYELLAEPPPQVTLALNENDAPERAAERVIAFLSLNRRQLQSCKDAHAALKFWKQTVEEKGILVCQMSVNPHLSVALETGRGFCIAQKPLPVIVLNGKDSPYPRIFTLIHELVHIALGQSAIQNTASRARPHPALNPTEVFCNQVAAEVLMPTATLLQEVETLPVGKNLSHMSKRFHVSPDAIMTRLFHLGEISPADYQTYRKAQREKYQAIPAQAGFARYPNRLLNAAGEHLARTAFRAYHEDKITLAGLTAVFSNCDTKHLAQIEGALFA